jgi:hypothetical protein
VDGFYDFDLQKNTQPLYTNLLIQRGMVLQAKPTISYVGV